MALWDTNIGERRLNRYFQRPPSASAHIIKATYAIDNMILTAPNIRSHIDELQQRKIPTINKPGVDRKKEAATTIPLILSGNH